MRVGEEDGVCFRTTTHSRRTSKLTGFTAIGWQQRVNPNQGHSEYLRLLLQHIRYIRIAPCSSQYLDAGLRKVSFGRHSIDLWAVKSLELTNLGLKFPPRSGTASFWKFLDVVYVWNMSLLRAGRSRHTARRLYGRLTTKVLGLVKLKAIKRGGKETDWPS